jgi:hypothetical protein
VHPASRYVPACTSLDSLQDRSGDFDSILGPRLHRDVFTINQRLQNLASVLGSRYGPGITAALSETSLSNKYKLKPPVAQFLVVAYVREPNLVTSSPQCDLYDKGRYHMYIRSEG